MLGEFNTTAVAGAAAAPPVTARPPPAPRVVESAPRVRQSTLEFRPAHGRPTSLDELAASVRQFAEVLEATGSVPLASSVSGFRSMYLDLYA